MTLASDVKIAQALSNLWGFLETWLDDNGGVHGYVVHHHHDNLKILSPDTWTQAPCILGALEIYKKTGENKWLERASFLGDFLVNTYIKELHVYRNSNHEHKPLGRTGLIHNALPSYSLLKLAYLRKTLNLPYEKYYEIAKDNIQHFILRNWDDSVGAVSSEYHGKPAHIHNMNSAVIMALSELTKLEDNSKYVQNYAYRIADYILNCQVKKGLLSGAYPYTDKDNNYRTLYSFITALGLIALYEHTQEEKLILSVMKLITHLSEFIDNETGLICHFHRKGYPQWIPDTFLFLAICNEIGITEIKKGVQLKDILNKLIHQQYPTGGFMLSLGFEDLWYKKEIPSRPNIHRWRDILATPNWNAWNFWSLSKLLPVGTKLPPPKIMFPLEIYSDREEIEGPYKIVETKDTITFYSVDERSILGLFRKKENVASYCMINERGRYWGTIQRILKYPKPVRKLILALPDLI